MWSGIWSVATTSIGFWNSIWSARHCELGQELAFWFQCWENSSGFNWLVWETLVQLMWKWMGLILRKNHLLKCCHWPSLLNWIGALILSLLLNQLPRKLEPWFVLWSLFSWVALYLYKSTICPCIEHYCHVGACAPSCYLELLDKLQKQIYKTVGPSLLLLWNPWLVFEMCPA